MDQKQYPKLLAGFRTTQCSWCAKFYAGRSECPVKRMQSHCASFTRLSGDDRDTFRMDNRWWPKITERMTWIQDNGMMAKCRECAALNPNPQKNTCWHCGGDTLRCPEPGCAVKPILEYDVLTEWWTCPGKDCGKAFQFLITTSRNAPSISAVTCPGCGERLNYYVDRTAWECRNCGRTYLSFAELDRDRQKKRLEP